MCTLHLFPAQKQPKSLDLHVAAYGIAQLALASSIAAHLRDAPVDQVADERQGRVFGSAGIDAVGLRVGQVAVRCRVGLVLKAAANSAPSAAAAGLVAIRLLRALLLARDEAPPGSGKTSVLGGVPRAVALEVSPLA